VQSNFEGFAAASEQLKLLRGGGSKVTLGNQVTVPLGGSLLSVEPVYVSASAVTNPGAYPQVQRYLAFYYFGGGAAGNKVGFGNTLTDALAQVFGGTGQTPTGPGGPPGGQVSARVRQFLAQAEAAYKQAQIDLHSGRLDLYYQDIVRMKAALDQARQAAAPAKTGTGTQPTGSPSPSPSASSSP
jgi:uncharacterized membrane protein (UPF0182 family)